MDTATINLNVEVTLSSSEACLLSGMMHAGDKQQLQRIAAALHPGDFESPIFARIFTAMTQLLDDNRPIDAATVRSYLQAHGGATAPADLINFTIVGLLTLGANDLHIGEYARQVVGASYRRQFAYMAQQLRYAAETAPEDELMNIMVEHGIGQRQAWNRYQNIDL